jgi:hypothetical protein
MSNEHANGRLYMLHRSIDKSTVGNDRGNGSMDHMVDLELLQWKDLGQSTPDLILQDHCFKSPLAIDLLRLERGSNNNWVEIIMTELTSLKLRLSFSIPKDCSIGVPLPNSSAVGSY